MLDNFIEIYNNIIELLKEIDRLNYEYKNIQNDADKLANSNNIDEIERQVYELENLLLNNYENSNYFFQVTNYKKWLINNGTYIDNVDYLNKKINLMMMMCERIAYAQSCEKNEINSQLDSEKEKFEYEKQLQKLEYEKELQKYELQQQALEYERELQRYELEQQQAQEYERELQRYELEQQQAQEYERELQKYEQEMIDYENNIQANTNFNYYNDQNTSGYDQQMGYDQSQMGYDQQMGFDQSQIGYDQQMGYDQSQMGYDQSQIGYDQQMGYDPNQMGYDQSQLGYEQQNPMGYEQSYQ